MTTHVPVPEHGAPQPVNVEPVAGAAVNVTCVPLANGAAHVAPQLIPAGALVTVPVPVPALVTVKVKFVAVGVNVAVTVVAAVSVTMQLPVPEHGASQPVKVEPVAGAAVNVTCVPLANGAAHVAPQLIPAGALVTVPVPVPALVTVSVSLAGVDAPWHSVVPSPGPAADCKSTSVLQAEATYPITPPLFGTVSCPSAATV